MFAFFCLDLPAGVIHTVFYSEDPIRVIASSLCILLLCSTREIIERKRFSTEKQLVQLNPHRHLLPGDRPLRRERSEAEHRRQREGPKRV